MTEQNPDPTSPADPEDTGTGIGSDVKSGTGLSEDVDNSDSAGADSHDAVGGTAPLNDDPTGGSRG